MVTLKVVAFSNDKNYIGVGTNAEHDPRFIEVVAWLLVEDKHAFHIGEEVQIKEEWLERG